MSEHHEILADPNTLSAFAERAKYLSDNVAGFDYLLLFVQAQIVAESLVMEELYRTIDIETTRTKVMHILADHHALVVNWGCER